MPTPIYHFTHVNNLVSILAQGLLSNNVLKQGDISYTDVAHRSVQDRRATKSVSCGPGGVLHDYVPFYFAPRSPMLFTISKGNVEGYSQGQEPLIYISSTAQAVKAAALPFVFTDGHGIMAITKFFDDLIDLREIDWAVMARRYWKDTPEDNERCRRRQAEFLIHGCFPWNLTREIGVMNFARETQVRRIIKISPHQPQIRVHSEWYY
ncbi:MAG: DUF4433 domain-containing protein [Chroococcidiopsidaceae cyanobacterium CP_BM_ER_R8_30]|nr:DUF4433 domain-containing protein [Chroococcidiopsidaceae cyanobacterium CP_BM_ER_R8_30]